MKVAMFSHEESQLPAQTLAEIRAAGIEIHCKKCVTPEELLAFAYEDDVLWFWGPNLPLTPETLEKMKNCKAVFRSGSGIDAIPCAKAQELGIAVCNTPESISESVAEHAVSLLFALVRQIPQYDREVRKGNWLPPDRLNWHITGRTLGLVGYGRIARAVEHMVSGFNMNVIHYDPYAANSVSLDELLEKSDFISVHCPLTDATKHLLSTPQFAKMKKNALLVNTSRGPVIDEPALVEALKNHVIGGAAIDVTDPEPPAADSPLYGLDNLIITPHVAAFSADFEKNFWNCSVAKLKALSTGDYKKNSAIPIK